MSKNLILKLKDFTISYEPTYHRSRTVRDFFVEVVKNPFNYFFTHADRMVVLRKVNLEINKGDVIGILGTNGVGKTSLCRYLSGIIKHPNVEIYGDTRALFDGNVAIYPDLTGRENAIVLVELLYSDLTVNEKKELIEEAVIFSELDEHIDTPVKNYSRGMKARLFLSLLTFRGTDLLVIDEAFGGTDQFFSEKLEQRIQQLISKCGAVAIVSHSTEEIKKYCNRIIVLHDKQIAFDGSTPDGIKFYNSLGSP
jgi:ABC-type polysaccharide/polyol phosphate transport system ATPase subunit